MEESPGTCADGNLYELTALKIVFPASSPDR